MNVMSPLPEVTVHGYGPAFGFPDLSPFVVKILYYARAQGFPVNAVVSSPRKSPRSKLPFIEVNGTQLCDSRFIIQHLESIHPQPMNGWMSAADHARAQPLQSMLEEHLYFITLCGRWVYEDGYAVLHPVLVNYLQQAGIPAFLAPTVAKLIRKSVIKQSYAQGAGRLSREEHHALAMDIFSALDHALGDKPYILGDKPCTLDCTVGAFTTLGLISEFQHEVSKAFLQFPRLQAYGRRSHENYLAGA